MSKYADHARAMAESLSPEDVLKQIETLNKQMEALAKSQPMFKADGEEENQEQMDQAAPEMPSDLAQAPAPEGEEAPVVPAPEGEEAPVDAEEQVEQAADAEDDSELQEIFGDLSTEELQEVQQFLGKLLASKAQAEQPAAPQAPSEDMEMSVPWKEMKKSQTALQAQIESLTKSITVLAEKVAKPAVRPASRPALMNSDLLAKSDRVPEMLKKSEVLDYLGSQIKKDPTLVGLYQDATMAGEDSASLRSIYAKAERQGVKIPTKTF